MINNILRYVKMISESVVKRDMSLSLRSNAVKNRLKNQMNVIGKVAKDLSVPRWWVEAIVVEYLDCRNFRHKAGALHDFNFANLSKDEVITAVNDNNIVMAGGILFHNVKREVLGHRMLAGLVSNVNTKVAEEPSDVWVEGLASNEHDLFIFNSFEVVDPKQELSEYFQVLEDGEIWQWKFASFTTIEGRSYGKYLSEIVDLEEFDKLYEVRAGLYSSRGQLSESDFGNSVSKYYDRIATLRSELFKELLKYHHKKKDKTTRGKVTDGSPPIISRFETLNVVDGAFHTRCYASPIFYRCCVEHSIQAKTIADNITNDIEYAAKLDVIYGHRAAVIVMGSSCLEGYINQLGYEHFPDVWDGIEKLDVISKYQLFLKLKGCDGVYNAGSEPFCHLSTIAKRRNKLVHFKSKYEKVKKDNSVAVTSLNSWLDDAVDSTPEKIKAIIEELCRATQINAPAWLAEAPDWKLGES